MLRSRVSMAVIFAVAVVMAACGSSETREPSVATPGTIQVHASAETFASLSDMAEASGFVIVGTVVEIVDGRFTPAPATEDFLGTQSLRVMVEVEQVLKGDSAVGSRVSIPWRGYDVMADGTRGPQMIVNGQPTPEVGDRDVWFLSPGVGVLQGYLGSRSERSRFGEIRLITAARYRR